eukprot:m.10061 g.10061  ORF g.10061 m.10061 type:complete len:160 (-) comp5747_c0_seq1:89-568(-)
MSKRGRCWWWPFSCLCSRVPGLSRQKLNRRVQQQEQHFPLTAPIAPGRPVRPLIILDVRRVSEYEGGHIAGAISIPITTFKGALPDILKAINSVAEAAQQEPEVVCICLSAHRSVPATRLLLAEKVDAKQLDYGMMMWSFPTTKEPYTLEELLQRCSKK